MKNIIFLCLMLLAGLQTALAQDNPNNSGNNGEDISQLPLKDRIFYGGNFSLQLGNVTLIDVSPLVGYRLTNKMQIAAGATYQYINFRNFVGGSTIGSTIYGGRVFGRYFVIPTMFLQAEYEALNLNRINTFTGERNREWVPAAFVGGGYSQRMGNRSAFVITILYNAIWDARSAYASPWVVRAGFQL